MCVKQIKYSTAILIPNFDMIYQFTYTNYLREKTTKNGSLKYKTIDADNEMRYDGHINLDNKNDASVARIERQIDRLLESLEEDNNLIFLCVQDKIDHE